MLGAIALITIYLLLPPPTAPRIEHPPVADNASNVTKPSVRTVTLQQTLSTPLNYHYTSETPMIFQNDHFLLNNTHKIIPFISIRGVHYPLTSSNLTYNYSIEDFGYKRKWELNIVRPKDNASYECSDAIGRPMVDYVGFDVTNCSKYSDIILRCDGVEIDFSDLTAMGYSVDIINDSRVVVKNEILLSREIISLDPTDQLFSSSTNKAYVISWTTTDNPGIATTEFSAAQYTNVTTSNDGYVTSSANQSVLAPCNAPTSTACSCYDEYSDCTGGVAVCRYGGSCTVGGCPTRNNVASSSNACTSTITRSGCNACKTSGCPL